MNIYVFGMDWTPEVEVKLSFMEGTSGITTTGLLCDVFTEHRDSNSREFLTCVVSSSTISLMPKYVLKSGEMVSVSLCSSSVVPMSIAKTKDITVIGKLYAETTLLYTTTSHKFDKVNTITVENPYIEGTSDPNSIFKLKSFTIQAGSVKEMETESGFTKSRLKFNITTENTNFNDQHILVILSDALYAQHLGYSHKMAVYLAGESQDTSLQYTLRKNSYEIEIIGPKSSIKAG